MAETAPKSSANTPKKKLTQNLVASSDSSHSPLRATKGNVWHGQTIRFTAQNVWFWSAKGNLFITLHATSTYENGTKRGQKRPISTQADCQANARGAPSPYQNLLQTQAANHRHRTKAARMRNGVYGVWRPFRKNFYFFLCRKKKNK